MTTNTYRKSSKRLANIKRVDYAEKRTFGWLVQLSRKGVKNVKFFSDTVYGGKKKALEASITYRDNLKMLAGKKYHVWRRSILRKNNTSGIVGVGRYNSVNNKTGKKSAFWQAFWDDKTGKRRSRKFSVLRYGEEEARLLAVKERLKQVKTVYA